MKNLNNITIVFDNYESIEVESQNLAYFSLDNITEDKLLIDKEDFQSTKVCENTFIAIEYNEKLYEDIIENKNILHIVVNNKEEEELYEVKYKMCKLSGDNVYQEVWRDEDNIYILISKDKKFKKKIKETIKYFVEKKND